MRSPVVLTVFCGLSLATASLSPNRGSSRIVHQSSKRSGGIYPRIRYNRECNAPGYGEFACVTCDDPTVKNELAVPTDRWKAAHGDDAWTQATRWWTVLRGTGDKPLGAITGFVPSVSWYWEGPEQWDCASIGETFCSSVVKCSDAQIPAAGMILTSFANIHMFAGVFAPQGPDTTKILKLLLDAFALSYGLIGAAVWAKMLRDIPFFKDKGDNHAWAKDSAMAAVAGGVILAKDASPTGYADGDDDGDRVAGSVATLNDLTRVLGALVDGWAGVTSKYLELLFSGSDEGIEQLGTYIKGGEWYNTEIETGLFSLQGIMENVLYGQLIPKAWEERPAVHPVIVFQSESNIENPLTTILKDSADRTLKNEAWLQDALKVRTVYGGTTLWLLDAHDCGGTEPVARGGSGACNTPFVQLLPGSDKLDGKEWGGIVVDDITIR
ncbi:MAG: hypothetical protein Q9209_002433 [Squamulea sp. 1 TL-2023]